MPIATMKKYYPQTQTLEVKMLNLDLQTILILMLVAFIIGMVAGITLTRPNVIS